MEPSVSPGFPLDPTFFLISPETPDIDEASVGPEAPLEDATL